MSTWLDTRPAQSVNDAVEAIVQAAQTQTDHRAVEAIRYSGGDARFALWLYLIDQDEEEMREGWDLVGTIVFVGTELYHIDADGEDDPIDASVPDRVLDLVSLH